MATRLATATRNAMADAAVDRVDVGSTNPQGRVRVYTGSQPASAEDAPSGTLLLEFNLNNPAYDAAGASPGVAALDASPVPSTTGITNGTAGWARVINRDVNTVFDVAVTATGGGGEMQLSTTAITTGLLVEITAGSFTQPAG